MLLELSHDRAKVYVMSYVKPGRYRIERDYLYGPDGESICCHGSYQQGLRMMNCLNACAGIEKPQEAIPKLAELAEKFMDKWSRQGMQGFQLEKFDDVARLAREALAMVRER